MTYAQIAAALAAAGIDSPEYDAARLIEHFCGAEPSRLRFTPDRDFPEPALAGAVARRAAREPL
ncbi:MAG: peptide chain release factor N(5)-glutamine methyltransferase, partial [Clostridia bacterium]|nr:peptide chain release factor N(5)-glutamine methyltransferase [Clostridia bacterium]